MWQNSNSPSLVKLLFSFSFAFLVNDAYVDAFLLLGGSFKIQNGLFCKEWTFKHIGIHEHGHFLLFFCMLFGLYHYLRKVVFFVNISKHKFVNIYAKKKN